MVYVKFQRFLLFLIFCFGYNHLVESYFGYFFDWGKMFTEKNEKNNFTMRFFFKVRHTQFFKEKIDTTKMFGKNESVRLGMYG